MLVKAIIEQIIDNYSARIRIPIFHKSANSPYCTNFNDLPIASICTIPGLSLVLKVGDIVYVDFEKDEKDLPVIMGVLAKPDIKSSCDISAQSVDIEISCNLPENTSISKNNKLKQLNMETNLNELAGVNNDIFMWVPKGRILGDVAGDGAPDDSTLILNIAAGQLVPTDIQFWCADINKDNSVTGADAQELDRYIAELSSCYKDNASDYYNNWTFDADANNWFYVITTNTTNIVNITAESEDFSFSSYDIISDSAVKLIATYPPIVNTLIKIERA